MNKKELNDFLIKEGFENINEDEEGTMYEQEGPCEKSMTVFVYPNNSFCISYCHNASGYCQIKNGTLEQIKMLLCIFQASEFCDTSESDKLPMVQFKLTVLSIMKQFLNERKQK